MSYTIQAPLTSSLTLLFSIVFCRSETPETVLEEQEPESPEHNGIKGLIEDLHGHKGQDHPDGDLQVSEVSSDSTSRQGIVSSFRIFTSFKYHYIGRGTI